MASDLRQRLDRIAGKARLLSGRYQAALEGKVAAEQRVAELEATIAEQQGEIERLRLELEYQRIATTLAPSREDLDRSRAVLSGLVREIDKCIDELNS